jgi:hypothetical protein
VYISKPNDYPHAPCKLLLFLTNGTGIKSLNNQVQADKYAHEGFLVVMPDLCALHACDFWVGGKLAADLRAG